MSPAPKFRSRAFYRAVLVLPVVVLLVLLGTGRFQAQWSGFSLQGPPRPEPTRDDFVTNIIWLLALAPLVFAAWEIGRHHAAARRLNLVLWIGLREVVRHAFGRKATPAQLEAYDRPPRDRPGIALLLGGLTTVFIPGFFMSVSPALRSGAPAAWVIGAGVLMGGTIYCHRRAMAYLVDEPGRWDFFRQYRLLNPARYEPAGRRF